MYLTIIFLFLIAGGEKSFTIGSPNSVNSFHRSSSTPVFPSPSNGPPINNGPHISNGPPINNGPLGSKGLRGGGFKSNATVSDNFVSNMAQISISTNKVCVVWLCAMKNTWTSLQPSLPFPLPSLFTCSPINNPFFYELWLCYLAKVLEAVFQSSQSESLGLEVLQYTTAGVS